MGEVTPKMTKRILTLTALAILSTLVLAAQPTPPTTAQIVADQVARLTTLLDLTATQQTQASMFLTTEQTTLATVHTSLQTEQTALKAAILTNDASTIGAAATQIGTLDGQQVLAQATAAGAIYAILTTTQQTKFTTLQGAGLFGGPGGPGGHGPGPGGPH
jgi:hypothetical protein